ncbi:nmd5p [Saccharomyces arboricola H-6]|uniref:Nmd5p n=1 Tax=Saccharomyces arboricola (strain H-6 / AS 2.3317 / CBS 10644) TaxID=1160507 RepID=J8Q690_SACAR|nr:nmd5p [Saccharomyces arboricola H-6]
MNITELLHCFACTLDHNATVRTNAESHLKNASKVPGFLGACLDIIAADEVPENIKLSASLYFKNKITYGWCANVSHGSNELLDSHVDPDEKPVVKDMLIKTMVSVSKTSPRCNRVLKSALTVIISEDYPSKRWDDLLPNSLELLSNEDLAVTYVGLLCLSEIFRTYRWKNNDERQGLEELILNYFPALLNYGANVLFQDGKYMNNEQVGELVKLIVKIYKFVSYHDLPFTLQRPESFTPWACFFVNIVQQPLPQEILAISDIEVRSKNPWVKCKKWALANLYRLFQRYASTSLTRKFQYDEFKQMYCEQFLTQFLQVIFKQIEEWGTGQLWLSDECLYYILNFIEQCVVQKAAWKLVGPHYNVILQHVIFPLLKPSTETLETFENDPQEYINRNMDFWDVGHSPDLAALSLLTTCVTKRGKTTLQPTLGFLITTLQNAVVDYSNITLDHALQIESSLRIFSSIIDRVVAKGSPFANEMENFLLTFVLPFFKSQYGFLQSRVCDICSKLGAMNFKDPIIISTIYEGVMNCLNNSNDSLPVELMAALALQTFISDDQFNQELSRHVVPTMQKLLNLSNDFESDVISGVMQDFVEQFAEQLQPFGVELMNTLVQQFLKLAIDLQEASNVDPDSFADADNIPDESEKQMAALGILSTTISILLSFENSPEILKNLEQSFYPAAEFILKNDIEDFYRECCEFVENSTFLLRDITPISWKTLELMGECNRKPDSTVSYYLSDFMLALNNILIYGKNELKKNEFYTKIIFEIYQKAVIAEDNAIDDLRVVFDLSQELVLALGDDLPQQYRERLLEDVVKAILTEKNELKTNIVFSVTAFNVVISNLITEPMITLQYLKQQGCLELFFQTWITDYIPNYKRCYDIKLSVLALLKIIINLQSNDYSMLNLENLVPQLGTTVIQLASKLPTALRQLANQRKEFSSSGLEADAKWDEEFLDVGDDDDDESDLTEKYMELIKNRSDSLDFVDGYDAKESFDDLEEDPLTGSILDTADVYKVFNESIISLQHVDSNRYQGIMGHLTPADQELFMGIMNA